MSDSQNVDRARSHANFDPRGIGKVALVDLLFYALDAGDEDPIGGMISSLLTDVRAGREAADESSSQAHLLGNWERKLVVIQELVRRDLYSREVPAPKAKRSL